MPHKDTVANRNYQREWARKNKPWRKPGARERITKAQATARARRKRLLDAAKLTAGCAYCGYSANVDAIQLDHPIPVGRRTSGYRDGYMLSWSKLAQVLADCQFLCANCHAIKSAKERRG